jgi:LPS sulfotransferase NodH
MKQIPVSEIKPSLMVSSVRRSFTMAFTMRSGSNAICDLLAHNGIGSPTEYFQNPRPLVEGESWPDAFIRFVRENQREGTFGSKMAHYHRVCLDELLRVACPGYRILDDILPDHRWLWLIRRDKVLQAISLYRAELSGQWAATDTDLNHGGEVEYDFFQILSRIVMIHGDELIWEVYFRQHGIDPYVIVYEDFFAHLECEFRRLVAFLGGLPPGRVALALDEGFKVQRDIVSYRLKHRFMADVSRISEMGFDEERSVSLQRLIEPEGRVRCVDILS